MAEFDHAETLTAFDHAAEEIRFFKSQQWRVANYALLADAALVTAPAFLRHAPDVWHVATRGLSAVLALTAMGWALYVLAGLETAIGKERTRMTLARARLPVLDEIHRTAPRDDIGGVLPLLFAAVIVGAVFAAIINGAALIR